MKRINTKKKRPGKKSYSAIVDGETEIWYLQLMKKHENLPRIDIKPELPKKKKLNELFELVQSNAKIYDKVFWILDLDVILQNNKVREFEKYVNQLKNNDKVVVLINNPCLEFWYLIHFKETSKVFLQCDNVIKELRKAKVLSDYEKTEKYYKSSQKDIYTKLKPFQAFAIERANRLGNLDFHNINAAKAEIYKLLNILTE